MRLDRKALYSKLRTIIWGVMETLEVGMESHDHIGGGRNGYGLGVLMRLWLLLCATSLGLRVTPRIAEQGVSGEGVEGQASERGLLRQEECVSQVRGGTDPRVRPEGLTS